MTTEHKPHSELVEAMERAHDSWAGRPYPVGPGVSQEFARAVQDRTTLAAEVTRLEEQFETASDLLRRLREWDIIAGPGTPEGEFTADAPYWRSELDRVLSIPASEPEHWRAGLWRQRQ